MSYVNARLEQWAEYLTKKHLVPIGTKKLSSSDIKLYKQEIEAERLAWVKRTHRAVLSLESELRDVVQLRYLFSWRVEQMGEYYGLSKSTVSRRLEIARYSIADFYQAELDRTHSES